MKKPNYAVLILTHGRPDNVVTTPTLRKSGYTGQIYYILDTQDKTIDKYKENFGEENIVVFDKEAVKGTFDIMDNQDDDRAVVFARNEAWNIARKLGLDYFMVLDDDYTALEYTFGKDYEYIRHTKISNITPIFEAMIKYIANTNIKTICFAQGGDFIGGQGSYLGKCIRTRRKAMNLFVFSTDRQIQFTGRINEDVNAYTRHGMVGDILLTTSQVSLEQLQTQSNDGGLTDIYLASGTYVKSFYTVIANPSSVKINMMGNKHRRLHHVIKWNNTVPKIIDEKYKK